MRRNVLRSVLSLLFILPLLAFGQNLKTRSFNPNAKQWYFETFPVNVKSTPSAKMNISLKAIDTTVYLQLKGSGAGTSTVDKDDQVILSLDNNGKVNGRSLKLQAIEYGDALPFYQHEYVISISDLEMLSKSTLRSVRKFSVGSSEDIALDAKNLTTLKSASAALLDAIKKEKLLTVKTSGSFAPGFPGGKDVYLQFLNRNFKIPQGLKNNADLNVKVKFTVLEDGTPTAIQVVAPPQTGIDQEIQRILTRMPKWKPGFENNQVVAKQVEQTLHISRTETATKISL